MLIKVKVRHDRNNGFDSMCVLNVCIRSLFVLDADRQGNRDWHRAYRQGRTHQGARWGEGRHSSGPATAHLLRQADVSCFLSNGGETRERTFGKTKDSRKRTVHLLLILFSRFWSSIAFNRSSFLCPLFRNDDKTASDYKVTGGSVLHLVLALRGGNLTSFC